MRVFLVSVARGFPTLERFERLESTENTVKEHP